MKIRGMATGLLVGLAAASSAPAAVTFTGSDTQGRSASATFEISGASLTVLLTNTSLADTLVPIDVLTGVFFDSEASLAGLTAGSAVLPVGSGVIFGAQPAGGVVGGEWAWNTNLSGGPGDYGISSTGLGLFGPGNLFPGTNLDGPESPGGLQFGIVSAGDNPNTGNTPVNGSQPLINNSVLFTLNNVPLNFELSSIFNVTFQYGTSLSEPSVEYQDKTFTSNMVPAPAAVWGGLMLMGGIGAWQRRRRAA